MATSPLKLYFLRVSSTKKNKEHPVWEALIGCYVFKYTPTHEDVGPGWAYWHASPDIDGGQMWLTLEAVHKAQKEINFDTRVVCYWRSG